MSKFKREIESQFECIAKNIDKISERLNSLECEKENRNSEKITKLHDQISLDDSLRDIIKKSQETDLDKDDVLKAVYRRMYTRIDYNNLDPNGFIKRAIMGC